MLLGGKSSTEPDFISAVARASGHATLLHCYQCGKCTAGCPLAFGMDHKPNQIIRLLQLGRIKQVLGSRAIWICAGCWTCTTRCPCGIDIAQVMDSLRVLARNEGETVQGKDVVSFNELFLQSVRRNGRVFEFGVFMGRNLRRRKPFLDADLGRFMLTRGKLRLTAERIKGTKEVRRLFSRQGAPVRNPKERTKE
ncbi:MAG: heterodisulfide reductase subunit C [Ammonifex sp.]|nr:MAG: heterodisulfide reductase subunit C [Ammonifex sp.]